MCELFNEHIFFDDLKTATEICQRCGFVNNDILIEIDSNLVENCILFDKNYKFINEIKNYAYTLNLSQDAITLATDIYNKYTKENKELRILPLVCLFLAAEKLGYSIEMPHFYHLFDNSQVKKFKKYYERVEKFVKVSNFKNEQNKLLYYFNKFEKIFFSFKTKHPYLKLNLNDFYLILDDFLSINSDISLINKSEKGNFLICLLNYKKIKNSNKILENDILKFYGLNKTSFRKISEIYSKIMN